MAKRKFWFGMLVFGMTVIGCDVEEPSGTIVVRNASDHDVNVRLEHWHTREIHRAALLISGDSVTWSGLTLDYGFQLINADRSSHMRGNLIILRGSGETRRFYYDGRLRVVGHNWFFEE